MKEDTLFSTQYNFNKKLSYIVKCKIAVHFSDEYEVDERFYLKHKNNNMSIQIEDYKIFFFKMGADEALQKYQEIENILCVEDAGGAE